MSIRKELIDARAINVIAEYLNLMKDLAYEITDDQEKGDKKLRDMKICTVALLMDILKKGESILPLLLCHEKSAVFADLIKEINENLNRLEVSIQWDSMKQLNNSMCGCDKE